MNISDVYIASISVGLFSVSLVVLCGFIYFRHTQQAMEREARALRNWVLVNLPYSIANRDGAHWESTCVLCGRKNIDSINCDRCGSLLPQGKALVVR